MHSTTAGEQYCTDSNVSEVTDQQINSWIAAAITEPSGSWDDVNGVQFTDRGDCDALGPFDLEDTEIQYYLNDVTQCGAEDSGCTAENSLCGGHEGSDYSHDNCPFLVVTLAGFFTGWNDSNKRAQLINHETGHTLGLADPCDSAEGCENVVNQEGTGCFFEPPLPIFPPIPIVSVMHPSSYCCPDCQPGDWEDIAFPSFWDRWKAQLIADDSDLLG